MDVTLMNAVHELLTGCATRIIIEADLFFVLDFVFCLLADSFSFCKAVAYCINTHGCDSSLAQPHKQWQIVVADILNGECSMPG